MPDIDSEGIQELTTAINDSGPKPDSRTVQEMSKLDLESKSLKNVDYAQNIEQRKQYAELIFTLVCLWLLVVLVIVVACGHGSLKLSDTILSILLGTTTANVCGFLVFVVKFLFNVEGVTTKAKDSTSLKKLKVKKAKKGS